MLHGFFSSLDQAIEAGNKAAVEAILNSELRKIDARSIKQAFQGAAKNGHADIVALLLKKRNEDLFDFEEYKLYSSCKSEALQSAADNGHADVITLLLRNASVEIFTEYKQKALEKTITRGHLDALNALLTNPSVLTQATFDNNYLLREAKRLTQDKNAERYQPIVNRLLQIPIVVWLDAISSGDLEKIKSVFEKHNKKISSQDKIVIFMNAAKNNQDKIVDLFLEKCDEKCLFSYKCNALKDAAQNGHADMLTVLLKKCNHESYSSYKLNAIMLAIKHVHLNALNALLADASVLAQITFSDDYLNDLKKRAQGENAERYQPIVDRILQIPNVAWRDAISRGDLEKIKSVFEKHGKEISSQEKIATFANAVKNNQDKIVELLLEKCDDEVPWHHKGDAFKWAAQHGYADMITALLKKCIQNTYFSYKIDALRLTVENAHLDALNALLADPFVETRVSCNDNYLLRAAQDQAQGENAERYQLIIDRLLQIPLVAFIESLNDRNVEKINNILENHSAAISSHDKGAALLIVAHDGHADIVRILLEKCSDELSSNDKYEALLNAVKNGHLEALNALLADPTIQAQATYGNNRALQEAQSRTRGENIERYQAIVDRLMAIPAVQNLVQLMQQPANQQNVLAQTSQYAENSMRSLTSKEKELVKHLDAQYGASYQDKGWEQIRVEILSYLEAEYKRHPAREGYHYVWMLEQNKHLPVTFLPADTFALRPTGERCEIYWHDDRGELHRKVVPLIDVLSVYEQLGDTKGLPYLCGTSQEPELLQAMIRRFEIPILPNQDKALPLKPEMKSLSPQALVAYYRHGIHNAWRYLSVNNPWMNENADHVGQRHAIISKEDQPLISYLWLALNDKSLILEKGFSVESNLKLFAAVFAELNRSHNRDERALYAKDQEAYCVYHALGEAYLERVLGIKTTRADNLGPDTPSCKHGVRKTLFQSEYGHPLTRGLDVDVMRENMIAQLIQPAGENAKYTNLFDRLDQLPVDILKHIREELDRYAMSCFDGEAVDSSDAIMLDQDAMATRQEALRIPHQQINEIVENLKCQFLPVRIEEKHAKKIEDVFTGGRYVNYEEMARDWAERPLIAFAAVITEYLDRQIALLEAKQAAPLVVQFEERKRKRDGDSEEENAQPCKRTKEEESRKRKRDDDSEDENTRPSYRARMNMG